jgi:thiosulfate dehydrogenase [quinone] large subunit
MIKDGSGMNTRSYTPVQIASLIVLRIFIGWHFLYEGIAKLIKPGWSAESFLRESKWIFSPLFKTMADNPDLLKIINVLNIYGLILIGLGLILGALTRYASIAGIALVMLYYLCNPPLTGLFYAIPSEGNYLIVNKNLVEIAALIMLTVFPAGYWFGLDRLLIKWIWPFILKIFKGRSSQ